MRPGRQPPALIAWRNEESGALDKHGSSDLSRFLLSSINFYHTLPWVSLPSGWY